jgi:superfamily II DNA or RNA helicase
MIYKLRDYQQQGVTEVRQAYLDGYKAPLYVCPTGGGKTIIFCHIAENAKARK